MEKHIYRLMGWTLSEKHKIGESMTNGGAAFRPRPFFLLRCPKSAMSGISTAWLKRSSTEGESGAGTPDG